MNTHIQTSDIQALDLTPLQLDQQSTIHIAEWVDLYSKRAKQVDDNPELTIKWLGWAIDAGFIYVDAHGRLWSHSQDGVGFLPFHLEYQGNLIGLRLVQKAKN